MERVSGILALKSFAELSVNEVTYNCSHDEEHNECPADVRLGTEISVANRRHGHQHPVNTNAQVTLREAVINWVDCIFALKSPFSQTAHFSRRQTQTHANH